MIYQAMDAYEHLIHKYNVAAPRYTSYPTVPYWDAANFDLDKWKRSVKMSFDESNDRDGLSIYIHLPYCESLCTYCGCNTRITRNHQVELPYIEAVLKEWQLYRSLFNARPVIREIHLGGGTPTFFSAANLRRLIEQLLEGTTIHTDAEFGFEGHPLNTTEEHLRTLHQLGFRRISLGVQDLDPAVQLAINRIQTFEQLQKTTLLARLIGYTSVNFDLIYGLPMQTVQSVTDTISKVSLLMPDRIAFYSYAHVPWIKPGQRSFTEKHLPDMLTKQRLHELGRKMFGALGYNEVGMDHFALPGDSLLHSQKSGSLHRNFMGYTCKYTQLSVGLGVSAISDTWTAYGQNAKTVEEYLQLVNNGDLPVVKGHILTNEDLTIRRHILNIMCKGGTAIKDQADMNIMIGALERMQPLMQDGLLKLTPDRLTVTPLGKRFLRNICMAIDAYAWGERQSTPLFSMAG
ncbi:oxygen-independent coproporphyrinogen III oxidase [Mucilaginibacter daejeonensis]|uniref:oxygen-independent coproporphyrinogen III oxidase n=1 Tax=Mucilaginibacter daejeonensis TaxID=398049 RepID=UPI001D172D7B|nr:oxygen-independent coproporphyrinogen III oxidase [Mucilaginibacter daejeonensis]UEG54148.1 oxygen-independent coproporphyrinogen III oxidase [Mucilaginibacter daejeonensis]